MREKEKHKSFYLFYKKKKTHPRLAKAPSRSKEEQFHQGCRNYSRDSRARGQEDGIKYKTALLKKTTTVIQKSLF